MTTQNDSNELRVEKDDNIDKKIREEYGIAVACVTVSVDDKIQENTSSSTSSTSGGTGQGLVDFGDGKVTTTNILVPTQNAMTVVAGNLDDKKKKIFKNRAEKSRENREKEKEGHGE